MAISNSIPLTIGLIEQLRTFLGAPTTKEQYRVHKQDFTRHRILDFTETVVLLLTGLKMSIQNRMNRFFATLHRILVIPTRTAFHLARAKIKPQLFKQLHQEVVSFFYTHFEAAGLVHQWYGHRLLAIDGSTLNLPLTDSLKPYFMVIDNKSGQLYVQGLSSYLVDLRNKLVLNAELGPLQAEKKFLVDFHSAYLQPNDLLLLDRLYADYEVIGYCVQQSCHFVIRCPLTSSFAVVKSFSRNPRVKDRIINLPRTKNSGKSKLDLPAQVQVRLIKVYLPSGEVEVLVTDLLDPQKYPYEVFEALYQERWGVETYLNHLKTGWEVERGRCGQSWQLYQDFFATIFLTALEAVLCREPEHEVQQDLAKHPRKYRYQLNRSVTASTLAEEIVRIFLDPITPTWQLLQEIYHRFKQNLTPVIPGRAWVRQRTSLGQQIRHHLYGKRLWC